jgi:PAS domain S-box-containing protein
MAKMLGYTVAQMQGKELLSFMAEPAIELCNDYLKRHKQGISEQREFEFLRKDGSKAYLIMETAPITDEKGKYRGAISGVLDVTDRKRAEETTQMLKAEKMVVEKLRKLDRMRDEFVSTITHELRTPMTPLRSTIEMLLDGSLGELTNRQRSFIEMMARNVERLTQFTTEVLTLSRLESGRYKLAPKMLSLREALVAVIELMEQKAQSKNSTVSFDIDAKISAYVDGSSLGIIVTNLTNNAIVHTPEGTEIVVSGRRLDEDFIEVSVADNGQGIPPEALENLFDRFYQAKRETGAGYHGTGVGLAVCKALVEAMGGEISVESHFKEGTVFRFTLSAMPPQEENEEVKE